MKYIIVLNLLMAIVCLIRGTFTSSPAIAAQFNALAAFNVSMATFLYVIRKG